MALTLADRAIGAIVGSAVADSAGRLHYILTIDFLKLDTM